MEADLRQFYGVRLTDWFRDDPPSWRELYVLVTQLPEESRTRGSWNLSHELAALNVELTHALLVAVLRIGGVKDRIDPLRIPRPYDESSESKPAKRPPKVRGRVVSTLGDLKQQLGLTAGRSPNG